jgi:hypothetical protein
LKGKKRPKGTMAKYEEVEAELAFELSQLEK